MKTDNVIVTPASWRSGGTDGGMCPDRAAALAEWREMQAADQAGQEQQAWHAGQLLNLRIERDQLERHVERLRWLVMAALWVGAAVGVVLGAGAVGGGL